MNLLQDQIIVTHLILFVFFGIAWACTATEYNHNPPLSVFVEYWSWRICWVILTSITVYILAVLWGFV